MFKYGKGKMRKMSGDKLECASKRLDEKLKSISRPIRIPKLKRRLG